MKISNCTVVITTGNDRDKALSILNEFHNNLKGNDFYINNDIILTDLRDYRSFNPSDSNYVNEEEGVMVTVSENVYFDISASNIYPRYTDLS